VSTLVDAPARVDGVQLIGEMAGSGYRTPPSLVRRGDGQVLQLTPLLYLVLSAVDGRRSCAEIAEAVSRALGRRVSEDQVRSLVDGHLRPLGLLTRADGAEPELRRSNPLLSLKPRVAITDPRTTRRLTDPFRVLFSPFLVTAVVLGFLAIVTWVFFERGLGASAYDAFERPHLLLLVFVVTVLSGGFHEFGHAAATRYSGAQPGTMGAGLYLVWPAFYTDVTDSYRLDRAGRIRTDLGGLYFNAIVVVLTFVWWAATGWEALLLLVATQVLQMTQQLLPLLRFDGYHVLADLAGVPDLYHRIKPTLVGLLPHRWSSSENRVLTPRARVLITLWVLVTIPMMALMLLGLVAAVPRLLGSAGSVVREDLDGVARAWTEGAGIDLAAQTLQVLGVVLPVLAAALILGRVGARFLGGLTRWSQGSAGKRLVAALVTATVVTGLSWAWWPHPGNYRPIQPDERGLVSALLPGLPTEPADLARPAAAVPAASALPAGAAAQQRLSGDEPLVAAFPEEGELPTEDEPDLAIVLVPADGPGTGPSDLAGPSAAPSSAPSSAPSPTGVPGAGLAPSPGAVPEDEPWVFPFDQPLPPEEGDNQALATTTTDNTAVYDVAFALVWATGDEVLNVNEAHAYASCSDCVAVAVAFQVVLIMDDAQVVVPQNLAVAANYDCYQCITAAIASQLVLSVEEGPGEEDLLALGQVWNQLLQLANGISSYTLVEITEQLESFKAQIVDILMSAPPAEVAPGATTTANPSESPGSSMSPTPTGTPSASPTGTGTVTTPAPTPTQPGSTDPTTSPTPEGATSPDPSPSATSSSTPTPAPTSSPTPSPTPSPTAGETTDSPSPTQTQGVTSSPPAS
jgi:putative peptide zinc metalloprotease protein